MGDRTQARRQPVRPVAQYRLSNQPSLCFRSALRNHGEGRGLDGERPRLDQWNPARWNAGAGKSLATRANPPTRRGGDSLHTGKRTLAGARRGSGQRRAAAGAARRDGVQHGFRRCAVAAAHARRNGLRGRAADSRGSEAVRPPAAEFFRGHSRRVCLSLPAQRPGFAAGRSDFLCHAEFHAKSGALCPIWDRHSYRFGDRHFLRRLSFLVLENHYCDHRAGR